MTYETALTAIQVQAAQSQAQSIANSANSANTVIGSNKFVFFAAFDGINNDRSNPASAGDTQVTNVGVLEQLVFRGNPSNGNIQTGYYEGAGTPAAQTLVTGGTGGAGGGQVLPTQQMQAIANKAYVDFQREARDWLAADPTRSLADITTSIVGFSRGAPTGVIFSQLIAERGLTAADGTVLIPPGATRVSGMLLIDPISTGYLGNLAIPDGATNITVMRAQDEKRFRFEADDYSNVRNTFDSDGNLYSTTPVQSGAKNLVRDQRHVNDAAVLVDVVHGRRGDCYEFDRFLRPLLLAYRPKTLPEMDSWKVLA